MSIPKICPLLAVGNPAHMAKCRGDGCAWWDHLSGSCCMASGADYLRDVADQIDTLTRTKKTPASAANADEGKVEQSLPDTDSTSTITENGGFVK